MPRSYAFTTAAMAAALEETPVTYEDLAAIEREFDEVETEIIRQQAKLTAPLFTSRQTTVSKIPNFWPLVLEQAPPDIDQYIQPSDSALLLSSLVSFSVSRFEAPLEPRSLAIKFEFGENEYFEDKVLEKRFWYRRAKDGWQGLVSEPVTVAWKKDRDLTGGLLDMVQKAYSSASDSKSKEFTPEQKALQKKIDNTGMGGLSFFAWFGFIGRRISAQENEEALELEKKRRENGGKVELDGKEGKIQVNSNGDWEGDDDDEELDMRLEIFPDGEELALAFADDLWVGAIKYFTQAQEQDALSDADFESDDGEEEIEDLDEHSDGERPVKKQRSS